MEKLADLRRDREAMTVHAPVDGIVYYGRNDHGTWPGAAAMSSKLRKGGVVMADEVFLSVVPPRPLAVRTAVDEKDLHELSGRTELKGRAIPAALPDLTLPARLTSLTPVPRESGKFDVVADVELSPAAALIKPGMSLLPQVHDVSRPGRASRSPPRPSSRTRPTTARPPTSSTCPRRRASPRSGPSSSGSPPAAGPRSSTGCTPATRS